MRSFLKRIINAVYSRRVLLVYRHTVQSREGSLKHISLYRSFGDIPLAFRKTVLPQRTLNVMYYRLRRKEATLLCYSEDRQRLQAYGWVQSWRPFRRRFGALAKDGVMLGPFWTEPDSRGRGIYATLLRQSLISSPETQDVFIYTDKGNGASRRGIDKAGFELVGEFTFTTVMRVFRAFRRNS